MSKIICDICGTVYPDNAAVCPICGYPRQESEKAVLDDEEMKARTTSNAGTYVKGGRFSSKNVKKRHAGQGAELPRTKKHDTPHGQESAEEVQQRPIQKRAKAGPGLKITVSVLSIAVIAVGMYIGYRFISGADAYQDPDDQTATTPATTQQQTTEPEQTDVACVGLSVSDESITFEGAGRAWLLSVNKVPEDATEPLVFTSSDEKVATVDSQGRVTAVGSGNAVITITCGQIKRECKVICDFEGGSVTEPDAPSETTQPTETTGSSQYQDSNWVMSNEYGDATLIIGEEFSLELTNDAGETADVVWSADRDGVVSIDGNVIRGESVGMVDVTATIDGQTFTCIVRVIESR